MMQIQQRQVYSAAQADSSPQDRKGGSSLVVHAVAMSHKAHKQALFAGKDDGSILAWFMESTAANDKPWARFYVKKGCGIKSMAYISDHNILVTGSADGTLSIWDPWRMTKNGDSGEADAFHLIQQMVGHTSSVTALSYQDDCVISCSTDSSAKMWKADDGREIMQYPWFKCTQTLKMGAANGHLTQI